MRIGIVPTLNASGGGIYQYSLTMLRALHEWKNEGSEDEFIIFTYPESQCPEVISMNGQGWMLRPVLPSPSRSQQALNLLRQVVGEGPHREAWRSLRQQLRGGGSQPDLREESGNLDAVRFQPGMKQWFDQCGAEIMLYPSSQTLSFEAKVPYVMAIHDLQHRLQPEFPEVSANGEWEKREYLFRNGARYSTLLLADSEVGRQDILNCYEPHGVRPDQVKVLPFIPAGYLAVDLPEIERQRVRATYDLPERYLFYPAQFWPHKNHARIVQALGLLKQEYRLQVPIVFCGSYSDEIRARTFQELNSLVDQLGPEPEVRFLGHVPDEDMSGLYAEARALVMPTFFGPTNIPVLEAWAFGCPVITSDIRGIREQVGEAAVLVDPRSVEAIADGIYRLWTDDNLCRALADRGRQRLSRYTPSDYRRQLIEILEEAKVRVRSEKAKSAKR